MLGHQLHRLAQGLEDTVGVQPCRAQLPEQEGPHPLAAGVELSRDTPAHLEHELPHPFTELGRIGEAAEDHVNQKLLIVDLQGQVAHIYMVQWKLS